MARMTAAQRKKQDPVELEIPGVGTFTQKELSVFQTGDLLELVSATIEEAMAQGIDLDAIGAMISIPREQWEALRTGKADISEFPPLSTLIRGLLKLAQMVPGRLEDFYLLALSVPKSSWNGLREQLHQNLSHELAIDIADRFIAQNAQVVTDFLPRWKLLFGTAQETITQARAS